MKNLQTMKQSVQKGFTLIELMIVVAIIGILAALAIPAYTDYTIKSRVSEGASLVGSWKTAMEVYWSENGTLAGPTSALLTYKNLDQTAAVSPLGEYVSTVTIDGSAVQPFFEVQYKTSVALGKAAGTCIEYYPNRPTNPGGNIIWTVRSETGYTTKGGTVVAGAACDTGTTGTPDKYRPRT